MTYKIYLVLLRTGTYLCVVSVKIAVEQSVKFNQYIRLMRGMSKRKPTHV